jgi:hypothetical protein
MHCIVVGICNGCGDFELNIFCVPSFYVAVDFSVGYCLSNYCYGKYTSSYQFWQEMGIKALNYVNFLSKRK